jgi:hypothetical protein
MLKVLAILAVIFAVTQAPVPTTGQATNNDRGERHTAQNKPDSSQEKPASPPMVPKPPSSGGPRGERDNSHAEHTEDSVTITESTAVPNKRDLFDCATLFIGAVLAVVTIFGVVAAWRGLPELKRQAEASMIAATASLQQANYLIASDRPWLIPKITSPSWDDVMNPQNKPEGWHLPIEVTIRTTGKTTAIVINRFVTSISETTADRYGVPLKPNLSKTVPYTILSSTEREAVEGTIYAPGEPFFMYLAIPKETLEKHNAAWRRGEECLCIMGFVEYKDTFGKYHITRFCYAYQGVFEGGSLVNAITKKPLISPEFQKVDVPGYNEST